MSISVQRCQDYDRRSVLVFFVLQGTVGLGPQAHVNLAPVARQGVGGVGQRGTAAEVCQIVAAGRSAAVVNGWTDSPLMRRTAWLVRLAEFVGQGIARLHGRAPAAKANPAGLPKEPTGTFINKLDAAWLRGLLDGLEERAQPGLPALCPSAFNPAARRRFA